MNEASYVRFVKEPCTHAGTAQPTDTAQIHAALLK
jgi:hypothetical protein